jgi:hypothetical protein
MLYPLTELISDYYYYETQILSMLYPLTELISDIMVYLIEILTTQILSIGNSKI